LPTALLTTTTPLTCDASYGLVNSFVEMNPDADVYVVGAEGSLIPAGAQLISVDEIQSDHGLPLAETLYPGDSVAYCVPFALRRLISTNTSVFYMEPGLMVTGPLTAAEEMLQRHLSVVFESIVETDPTTTTPGLNKLDRRTGSVFERAVGFSLQFETAIELLDSWQHSMSETIVDPFLRRPSAVLRSLVRNLAFEPDTGIERTRSVADLENFCSIANRDRDRTPAILPADDFWEIGRPVLKRYEGDLDPAERRGDLLMQHRVHDVKPLEKVEEAIRKAQLQAPIDLHADAPFVWFARDVRRASDPLGLRWKPGDSNEFMKWMYETNSEGLTRAAHLYWYARSDLQEAFPNVTTDSSAYRKWNDERGLDEFGIDFFDERVASVNPDGSVTSALEWLAGRNRFSNAIAWRWTSAKTLLPGYAARLERMNDDSLTPRLIEPERVDLGISHSPFGPKPRQLTLMGLLRSNSGLGQAARSSFDALKLLDRSFSYFDTTDQYLSRNTTELGLASVPMGAFGDVNLVHANASEFAFKLGLFHHRLAGRYNVAMWFWEGARIPESYIPGFDTIDELWLASNYLADVFGQYGKVPVKVIGLAAELPQRSESFREDVGLAEDEFTFLFVYDAQSVPVRKNPEKALAAFIKAFGPKFEGVRFILKVHNLHKFPESERRLREIEAEYDAVTIVDEYLARRTMLDLMQHADVYVSLHAAEGFGLTLLESMALGTPVIATGFSGNMDFTNDENSWLVDYRLTALDQQVGPYPKGTVWADPDVDMAAEILRSVYNDRGSLERKSEVARRDATRVASLENYAQNLDVELRRLGV
jgi:glycosyltransferase involved in cell wall biosynthesis